MEPVSMIVSALAMGAVAAAKGVGGEVVKDAYNGLKALIVDWYKRSGGVAPLVENLSSETQKTALAAALAKTDVAKDTAVAQKAKDLALALDKAPRADLEAIGVRIGELRAVNAHFGGIEVTGPGKAIDINNLQASGDVTFGNIKVQVPN